MRALTFGLAALALALTTSACSEKSAAVASVKMTPAQLEQRIETLAAETFKSSAKGAADVAAVRDALPKAVSLTWGSLDFDAASGATVLRDVKLTPADAPQVGLGVSEIRLWDFNADFAKARLAGQRLGETGDLARRIEAKGVALFGLETLMGPAVNAYTGAIEETVAGQLPPDLAAEVAGSMQTTLDDYEFSIGRMVFDDVKLRPYELKLAQLAPDHAFAELMPMLQTYVAVSRSFGVDTILMSEFKGRMAMTQAGQQVSMTFVNDTYGVRGFRGSDMDAAFLRGMTFDMDAPMTPGATTDAPAPMMKMGGGVDYASMEGIRLDELAGYLARGEWPARTETDLMSYGLINMKNMRASMGGRDLYSIGEFELDARKWHWLIPAKVSVKSNDVVYDIKAFADFIAEIERAQNAIAAELSGTAPPPSQIDPAIMQLLTKYGLDKPSLDSMLSWDWDPETGATTVATAFGLDKYLRADLKYEGGFPNFKGVSDLIPGGLETAKGEEISALFQKASTLKAVELNVVDEGGLEKIYGLTSEIGKMMPPDQTGGVAVFSNTTPQGLRQMASAGVYMAADQAETITPGLKEIVRPFGDFLQKGGRVQFTMKPKAPVVLGQLAERDDIRTGMTAPTQLLIEWNAKTVHTPAGPVKP